LKKLFEITKENKMTEVEKVLIERDGLTEEEALQQLEDARKRVMIYGEDPEEILYEEFGLEPDYIFDLIG
jgi:hypothetical protein